MAVSFSSRALLKFWVDRDGGVEGAMCVLCTKRTGGFLGRRHGLSLGVFGDAISDARSDDEESNMYLARNRGVLSGLRFEIFNEIHNISRVPV